MTLSELWSECDRRGVRLSLAAAGGLAVDGPCGRLTPELLGMLKAYKAAIIAALVEGAEVEARERAAIADEHGLPDAASVWRAAVHACRGLFDVAEAEPLLGADAAWVAAEPLQADDGWTEMPWPSAPCSRCESYDIVPTTSGGLACVRCSAKPLRPPTRRRRPSAASTLFG